MAPDTFARAVRDLSTAAPFSPFVIELVTGVRWPVVHPDGIRIEDGLAHYVEGTLSSHLFDAASVLRVSIKLGAVDPGVLPPDDE